MRVRIALTYDIDDQAWSAEYGVPPEQVRGEVQKFAGELLEGELRFRGMLPGQKVLIHK